MSLNPHPCPATRRAAFSCFAGAPITSQTWALRQGCSVHAPSAFCKRRPSHRSLRKPPCHSHYWRCEQSPVQNTRPASRPPDDSSIANPKESVRLQHPLVQAEPTKQLHMDDSIDIAEDPNASSSDAENTRHDDIISSRLKRKPSTRNASPRPSSTETSRKADQTTASTPVDVTDGTVIQPGPAASDARKPVANAAIMRAMADYFGDDGRELEDYLDRPRNDNGQPMLRVLLIGSGPAEVTTAKVLYASDRVCGVYYCPNASGACEIDMEPVANSSTVGVQDPLDNILGFCSWASVDVVFVGPDHKDSLPQEAEGAFAAMGVTLFNNDVSAALADGSLSVADCFASLFEDIERLSVVTDRLVD